MSTTAASALTVSRLPIPGDVDGDDAHAFREMVRIGNVMCRHDAGHDALDRDAREVLADWHDTADWIHAGFIAEHDGTIIGVADMVHPVEEGTTTAEINVMVDPDHWGQGAEEALLEAVLEEARAGGRKTVQTWTLHRPDAAGPVLTPPTGFGGIPADDRQTVFMLDSGFSFEQVERNSAFDLHGSFDEVERRLADALAAAGADYRLVEWTSPTPVEHRATFAYVISRMQTDTPQGGLVAEEHHWDAERVRRRDARLASQGLLVSVVAVQHVETGAIVAYNELVIGADRGAATQQYGTLVLKEHRGHRLGTIVKCANLVRWRRLAPESPRVSTFNAEENRPMLDINEAIGFVPVSYAGAWQKELS